MKKTKLKETLFQKFKRENRPKLYTKEDMIKFAEWFETYKYQHRTIDKDSEDLFNIYFKTK